MPYPNVLSAEQKETLGQMLDPIQQFMAKVPSAKIDEVRRLLRHWQRCGNACWPTG